MTLVLYMFVVSYLTYLGVGAGLKVLSEPVGQDELRKIVRIHQII